MGDGIKPAQLGMMILVGIGVFAGGVFVMSQAQKQPTDAAQATPSDDDKQSDSGSTGEGDGDEDVEVINLSSDGPPPETEEPEGRKLSSVDSAPIGAWKFRSIWGLSNPGALSNNVKTAIDLLGGAAETGSYRFARIRLKDGSWVPAKPGPDKDEMKKLIVDGARQFGLGAGFESAVLKLGIRGLAHLTVPVTRPVELAQIVATIGEQPKKSSKGSLYVPSAKKSRDVIWHYYGWLAFGEDLKTKKVVGIKADMWKTPLIAPEKVVDGRSAPDPDYVKQKAADNDQKVNGPKKALALMGGIVAAKVITRKSSRQDPEGDKLILEVQRDLPSHPVMPNAVQGAAKIKRAARAQYLLITPSNSPPMSAIEKIMGTTKFNRPDTKTFPGQTITWHKYSWLEFGDIGGYARMIRITTSFVPTRGY